MPEKACQNRASKDSPVVVIGAGFVGVATALWLQRDGQAVTLVDKGGLEDRASYGNAGVLASSSVVPVTMPGLIAKAPGMLLSKHQPVFLRWSYLLKLLPWAARYLSHANEADARRIAAALTPIIGNSLDDHLALAAGSAAERRIKAADFAVLFRDKATFLQDPLPWDIRRSNGFSWTELDADERVRYDPVFDPSFNFMAVLGGHGQITDPGAYLEDLIKHFISRGGIRIKDEVRDIAHENGQVSGVRTATDLLPASAVAITAGAWSPLLTKKLGVNIPVEAESGYHVEFWGADKMPRSPTLFPGGKFIVTPMEGRLRVAGAVEFGGLGNQGREQPRALLRAGLQQLIPGLKFDSETQWIGHRPAPTDSIPVIDQLSNIKGVFIGVGHQHVGLTGSARTGQLLAELIAGRSPEIDMSPYRIDRFRQSGRRPTPPPLLTQAAAEKR